MCKGPNGIIPLNEQAITKYNSFSDLTEGSPTWHGTSSPKQSICRVPLRILQANVLSQFRNSEDCSKENGLSRYSSVADCVNFRENATTILAILGYYPRVVASPTGHGTSSPKEVRSRSNSIMIAAQQYITATPLGHGTSSPKQMHEGETWLLHILNQQRKADGTPTWHGTTTPKKADEYRLSAFASSNSMTDLYAMEDGTPTSHGTTTPKRGYKMVGIALLDAATPTGHGTETPAEASTPLGHGTETPADEGENRSFAADGRSAVD